MRGLLSHLRVRPHLVGAILGGAASEIVFLPHFPEPTRSILSLDIGGVLFLALTWHMMMRADLSRMRQRAREQDQGKLTVTALAVGAAVFSMTAITVELQGMKDLSRHEVPLHLALVVLSILCSWLVTQTVFALHYAHAYYGNAEDPAVHRGGLEFPGTMSPDYWDFLYFAFTIGMTFQTSDVVVRSRAIRRLTLAHAVLSFLFNTVIVALSVNIAAGLL